MNRNSYMNIMHSKLKSLPKEDMEDALVYISEYFDEAGDDNEESVIADLGSPEKLAAQIKADYTIKQMNNSERHEVKNSDTFKNIMLVILGILALPLSLPIFIVVLILIFVVFLCVFIIFVVFGCLIFAFLIVTYSLFSTGFGILFMNTASALILIGTGLIFCSLIIVCFTGAKLIFGKILPFLANRVGRMFKKVKGENEDEEIYKY